MRRLRSEFDSVSVLCRKWCSNDIDAFHICANTDCIGERMANGWRRLTSIELLWRRHKTHIDYTHAACPTLSSSDIFSLKRRANVTHSRYKMLDAAFYFRRQRTRSTNRILLAHCNDWLHRVRVQFFVSARVSYRGEQIVHQVITIKLYINQIRCTRRVEGRLQRYKVEIIRNRRKSQQVIH